MKKLCLTFLLVFMPISAFSPAEGVIEAAASSQQQIYKEATPNGCVNPGGFCSTQVDSEPKRK